MLVLHIYAASNYHKVARGRPDMSHISVNSCLKCGRFPAALIQPTLCQELDAMTMIAPRAGNRVAF